MKESALRRIETAARDGWRNFIPRHSSVDILKTVAPLVALKLISTAEIPAASAVLGHARD